MAVPRSPPGARAAALLAAALFAALLAASCASLPIAGAAALPPEGSAPSWQSLARGLDYAAFDLGDPPLRLRALRIDLAAPGVQVVVTPPSGRPGLTVGRRVSDFASAFGCVAAVNGGPFSYSSAAGLFAPRGLSISDGRLVSPPDPRYAALVFPASGGARVVRQADLPDLGTLRDAVGGFFVVLESGEPVGNDLRRAPRTAAGVSPDGRILYLLVADGRQRLSVGLTERESGAWLAWLGASEGLGLDGGGSSAMALRSGGGTKVVNVPINCGVPGWERVVGNCLGFRSGPTIGARDRP
ncbi:MAG: phosphodiester glycosidase family protein [Treponema sp.]|nr:phosphodiester glycosidase family protein [Treponema sp.]